VNGGEVFAQSLFLKSFQALINLSTQDYLGMKYGVAKRGAGLSHASGDLLFICGCSNGNVCMRASRHVMHPNTVVIILSRVQGH